MTSRLDTRPDLGLTVSHDDVTVAYGAAIAVRSASLDIEAGSITALLGPSGCGKTSLLRAIAGLERPRSGTIAIGDRIVSGPRTWVNPERRNVGMVFQDGALFPHLSVAENVAFGLRGRVGGAKLDRGDRARRVHELLELVDLGGMGDRLPDTLSGGQQQRVALARSLAPRPAVLLLDEPFSALDAALRVQVRAEVARIVREVGVTTVFVTHDQDEAMVLGDRVAVLRDGSIRQVGTPDALYRTPVDAWVAGFVGEANLISGSLGHIPRSTNEEHGTDVVAPDAVGTLLGPIPVASSSRTGDAPELAVLVRPEHVALVPGDCAEITNVEYYGHDVRYELRLDDGSPLVARTKAGTLHERGDRVCVRYDGGAAPAWPADSVRRR